jgi:hypothetical protein
VRKVPAGWGNPGQNPRQNAFSLNYPLTKIRNYGYIASMRNVSVLRNRRRLVKTGQIGPAEKGVETPPNPLSEPSPMKVNQGE